MADITDDDIRMGFIAMNLSFRERGVAPERLADEFLTVACVEKMNTFGAADTARHLFILASQFLNMAESAAAPAEAGGARQAARNLH